MAPGHSTLRNPQRGDYKEEHLAKTFGGNTYYQAPIPFNKTKKLKKKSSKGEGSSEEEEVIDTVTFQVELDPGEANSDKYKVKVNRYKEGTPESYCQWRTTQARLHQDKGVVGDVTGTLRILRATLGGKALTAFNRAYEKHDTTNQDRRANQRLDQSIVLLQALNDLSLHVFANTGVDSVKNQKTYLRKSVLMGNMFPSDFADRLEEINDYLKYFPVEAVNTVNDIPTPFDQEELIDIMDRAKNPEWQLIALRNGQKPTTLQTMEAAKLYYNQLASADQVEQQLQASHQRSRGNGNSKRRRKGNGNSNGNGGDESNDRPTKRQKGNSRGKPRPKVCGICGKRHPGQCYYDSNHKGPKPNWFKKKNGDNSKSENSHMISLKRSTVEKLVDKASKKGRKRRTIIDDSDDDSDGAINAIQQQLKPASKEIVLDGSDTEEETDHFQEQLRESTSNSTSNEETLNPIRSIPSVNPSIKKSKKSHYCAEIFAKLTNRAGDVVPARVLLDTGTTSTLVLRDFVERGRISKYKSDAQTWKTMGGNFHTRRKAYIDFTFPELNDSKKVSWVCHVDEAAPKQRQYDIIVGMDLMSNIGIYVNTADKTIVWEGQTIPLKQRGMVNESFFLQSCFHQTQEPEVLKEAESRQKRILDADYSKVDIDEYIETLDHLSLSEKVRLNQTLQAHPTLFGGGLGTLKVRPVHLEIKPGSKPYHSRAFAVPQAYERGTRKEINRFCGIGVMERSHESEWAAPTFIQPKKTGDIRVLTDFRRLNAVLKRKPFPLPKISDLLLKLNGFRYATAIDLSMGYYHIPLDEESQALCTTILPCGKFRYKRLPMGISNAPDIFQSIMSELLGDMDFVRVYIDDILIISDGTFEDHMAKLNQVLTRIETKGFRANVRKCFFARPSLEYLGYWLTRQGVQPQPKKVEAICRISAPRNRRQLRHFLGMVNYYRDMWRRRSHILAPLSALASDKKPWKWGPEEQKAFEEIKEVVSEETLLMFPQFDKPFHVYTDASNYQLGAVIMQENKPLAFYSRKLTDTQ